MAKAKKPKLQMPAAKPAIKKPKVPRKGGY